MLGDLLGSIGAIVAGVLVLLLHWYLADPVLAIGIACLIAISAIGIVRDTVAVLLEAMPSHLDVAEIRDVLVETAGVVDIHDLHVGTITSGIYALSCHCVVTADALTAETSEAIRQVLHDRFGFAHQTVQLETCRADWCPVESA